MPRTNIRLCLAGMASLALAGCSSTPNPSAPSPPVTAEPVVSEQAEDGAGAPAVSEELEETTALVYEWDTQYSSFLSPPIEVRRQAKSDCVAEGYEIAVVETMKLDGNIATAIFICRGDFE